MALRHVDKVLCYHGIKACGHKGFVGNILLGRRGLNFEQRNNYLEGGN